MTIKRLTLTIESSDGEYCGEECPFYSWDIHPSAYGGHTVTACRLFGRLESSNGRHLRTYACTEGTKEKQ